jgi:hypothetical protein
MFPAKEIKDMSALILDYERVKDQGSQDSMKNQIPTLIKDDEFLRDALITTHTTLNTYITEYKLICGHVKDNYRQVSTQYNYQGTNYHTVNVDDIQEAIDGAFFTSTNTNDLPVGNLFFHTTSDWDQKGSTYAEPNETPDIRNNFPIGNTRYKYDAWWPDTNSKTYKPYYYKNERAILSNLTDVITVYLNGLTAVSSTPITLTAYEPVIRYMDGTIPLSTIDWNGNAVEMYGIETLFQSSGTTCNYANDQLGLARDGNGSGSNYFVVKLLEKNPLTNISAPYYFKYKEIARNNSSPTGNVVVTFTGISSGVSELETMITGLMTMWKGIISTNTENIINLLTINPEPLTDDTTSLNNANTILTTITNWEASGTHFSGGELATLLLNIANRDAFLVTRMSQIANTLIGYNDTLYQERKNIIYWRINKKEGRLTKLADLCKSGFTGQQVASNNEEQLTYMKRRMIVKKLYSDGDGTIYFTTPISSDEDTYTFNAGDEVYLLSNTSTNQFLSSAVGKYTIISAQEKTVETVNDTGDGTKKVRVKLYKTNKIVSQTLYVKETARAVRILPPFDD